MQTITSIYPEITIIFAQYGSIFYRVSSEELPQHDYALLPAFADGILEGSGSRATIVDGNEITYPIMTYQTFVQIRRRSAATGLKLTAVPELYRSRMQQGFAVWPGHRSDTGSFSGKAEDVDKNHFNQERLEHALHNALAASDEYVWVWSERECWWPPAFDLSYYSSIYPIAEPYHQAVNSCRQPYDLAWSPIAPDTGEYSSATHQPGYSDAVNLARLGNEYELIMDLPETWLFRPDPDDWDGKSWIEYYQPRLEESLAGFRPIQIGEWWERQGYPYNGPAWYRVHFSIPTSATGKSLWLYFGGVANEGKVWIGTTGLGKVVTGTLLHLTRAVSVGEKNLLTVQVTNPQGPGGIWRPVKLLAQKDLAAVTWEEVFGEDFESEEMRLEPHNYNSRLTMGVVNEGRGGGKAYRISYSGVRVDTAFELRSPQFAVEGGSAYELRFDARHSYDLTTLKGYGEEWVWGTQVIWYDESGSEVTRTRIPGFDGPNTEWHVDRALVVAPTNATRAMICFGVNYPEFADGQYLLIDNFSFARRIREPAK